VMDEDGQSIDIQIEDEKQVALVSVNPYSFRTLTRTAPKVLDNAETHGLILENEFVRYEFSEDGTITSGRVKKTGQEVFQSDKPGNRFTLYEDRPNNWDAWDIDFFYRDAILEHGKCLSASPLTSGSVRRGIRIEIVIGNSRVYQNIYLANNGVRLDFETMVDWREKHKMLRVAFPIDVHFDQASYDIQYGYVKRPTHENTSWDRAKFEVVAHRYR